MKNLIAIIMGMALLFATNNIFAQKNKSKVESPEVRVKIEGLILNAEKKIGHPIKLNRAIKLLHFHLNMYRNSQVYVALETKRDMTIRLINIFNKIDDFETNGANKIRIIETIGRSDNSFEAHQFFLILLKSKNKKHREHALWSLSPKGVHGNDIYDEIKNLMNKGIISKDKYLYALKSANSNRALKEIINYIKKINNTKQFVKKSGLLCDYGDINLLDVIIDKYIDFKDVTPKTKKKNENYLNPQGAILTKLLLKYVQIKEGKRFKIALEILNKKGTTDEEEFPLILPKLKSKNIITREAVISFLENQVTRGSVKEGVVIPILEEAERNEKDKGLKAKINKKINNLKKRKQIKWKRN